MFYKFSLIMFINFLAFWAKCVIYNFLAKETVYLFLYSFERCQIKAGYSNRKIIFRGMPFLLLCLPQFVYDKIENNFLQLCKQKHKDTTTHHVNIQDSNSKWRKQNAAENGLKLKLVSKLVYKCSKCFHFFFLFENVQLGKKNSVFWIVFPGGKKWNKWSSLYW